jgi:predicted nuclease with TOPRIM domain
MFNRRRKSVDSTLRTLQNEVTALRNEALQRDNDVAALRTQLHALDSRLGGADARITQMATELANQLHELDTELEHLAQTADAASAETVTELRANQVRIASEQARYAITLRRDLAELAELLRKTRT